MPRLCTLQLGRAGSSGGKQHILTLDTLPQLTSLRIDRFNHFGVSDILNIASHSTLDDVCIQHGWCMNECDWLGDEMRYPISVQEDERQLVREARRIRWDGDIEEEEEEEEEEEREAVQAARTERLGAVHLETLTNGREEQRAEEVRQEMQRMRTALTRTQPTQRSCEVRLELAEWLYRRLRRAKLHTDDRWSRPEYSRARLRHYRLLVALLRCTLRQQLREATALHAAAVLCGFSWRRPCVKQAMRDGEWVMSLTGVSTIDMYSPEM